MTRRDTFTVAVATLLMGVATSAHAVLGVGDVVSDPIVEQNTTVMTQQLTTANTQLGNILQQDTAIALSVTTGIAGSYQPNTGSIASLDQSLFSNINSQNFTGTGGIFPGWQVLPHDSTTYAANLTAKVLGAYQNAFAVAQQQSQELQSEDFSGIAAQIQSPAVLAAIQGVGQAVLADVQQHQYERQLLIALIALQATHHGYELNTDAQQAATAAGSPLGQ